MRATDHVLTDQEAEMAKVAQRCIMAALDHSRAPRIALIDEAGASGEQATLEVPTQALRFFAEILGSLARREAVSLIAHQSLLTTQEAANYLNVSRPYLVRQLEEGKIDFVRVGRHRRIEFHKLEAYAQSTHRTAENALEELARQAQELNLGY
jgi:excisionase family DNA binding protein